MYQITLTKNQARVLSEALEVLARLGGIGQFRYALERLPLQEKFPNSWHEDMDHIGRILAQYTTSNVDGHRTSLGIYADKTSEGTKVAWDLHQVVRHRLSWDRAVANGVVAGVDEPRNWPEMMGAHYDDPMKTGKEPLAIINHV